MFSNVSVLPLHTENGSFSKRITSKFSFFARVFDRSTGKQTERRGAAAGAAKQERALETTNLEN